MKMKERWKWFCTDCTLLFLYFITLCVSTHDLYPTLAQQNGACFIKECIKNVKGDDMMVNFTTSTPANNYIGTNITVTCDKKIMRVCEAWVSKSNDNRNQTCILTISATSDHGSITVSNGAKYMSCKVEIGFYKGVQCVRGANDHQEIVEALYGGGVPIEQSSRNPTNAGPTNAGTPNASPTNASTTNASITKSAGGAVKDSTNITPTTSDKTTKVQSCAAAKNTLCISLMLALIFWSIYF